MKISNLVSHRSALVFCLFFAVIGGISNHAKAQVAMELKLNHKNYLQYETVFARLNLRNYSGHPLAFGESSKMQGTLKFEIETPDGGIAPRLNKSRYPSMLGAVIRPGATEKVIIPISRFYNITQKGKYRVKAVISHTQLPKQYESNYFTFNVADGIIIWENIVGVPNLTGKEAKGTIESRTAKIVSFFDGGEKVFYLVIEDRKRIFTAVRIGYDIGTKLPDCEIDSLSRIHIILQVSPKVFSYFLYNIDGKLEDKGVYFKTKTSPSLVRDPETGTIVIAGGRKAREGIEYKEEKKQKPFEE